MDKLKILHIINSLGTGGTEALLKNTIEALQEFQHVVLYLYPPDDISRHTRHMAVKFIHLQHRGWLHLPATIKKIRNIIQAEQPSLVHAHLFESSILARLATPSATPLVCSLHSMYSIDAFGKNRKSLWAERLTLKKRHTLIAVSRFVLDDYLRHVPFKGRSFVLYNFLPDHFFDKSRTAILQGPLRCVAVGNLKSAKNYEYLLEIFSRLRHTNIHLDIYGEGILKEPLQKKITSEGLKVTLKGGTTDVMSVFSRYDLFIQASSHEGFGLSVIEAMASGMPVFLSDIGVFHEITGEHAWFFPLSDSTAAARELEEFSNNTSLLDRHRMAAYQYCRQHYSEKAYHNRLMEIYNIVTSRSLLTIAG